jgi:hypothetical protein
MANMASADEQSIDEDDSDGVDGNDDDNGNDGNSNDNDEVLFEGNKVRNSGDDEEDAATTYTPPFSCISSITMLIFPFNVPWAFATSTKRWYFPADQLLRHHDYRLVRL